MINIASATMTKTQMNEGVLLLFTSWWIIIVGFFLLVTYMLYGKVKIFRNIGDVFMTFSFIKRTKLILLSYSLLALLVGIVGLFAASLH